MEHYLAQSSTYRNVWPEPDVTLELLRQAFWAFVGAKEPAKEPVKPAPPDPDLDAKVRAFGKPLPGDGQPASLSAGLVLTQAESAAWKAAGMPSPFEGWLKEYRRGNR